MPSTKRVTESTPLVSVIVVNWNGRRELESCLRSIQSTGYPRLEIIVLDNGSTDGSQSVIREHFPSVKLIETNENVGYALGNNRAVNCATGEYFLLVNNDATVESDCINQLIRVASNDESAGILGCKIFVTGTKERILEHAGGILYPTGYTTNRGYLRQDLGQYDQICDVDYVIGATMMINKRVTDRIGLFDPAFSLFYEDTDLCHRARKAGFRVLYVPMAIARHSRSATVNRILSGSARLRRLEKSRVYFVLKNFELRMLFRWFVLELEMVASFIVRPFESQSKEHLRALFESYVWNFRLLPTIIRRRNNSATSMHHSLGSLNT